MAKRTPKYRHGLTLEEAFWDRVETNAPGGCWQWIGSRTDLGYGRMNHECQWYSAHRLSYELHKGAIPDGLVIDHLCRNTSCVNPAHLEAVTDQVNILRGTAPTAIAARKTHCPQGHPYAGDNLVMYKTYRMCRTCKREQRRKAEAKARSQAA